MLKLPRLQIERDDFREVELLTAIRTKLAEDDRQRGDGVHASDLLDVRLAFFNKVAPKEVSERSAYFFIIGKALHTIMLSVVDTTRPGQSDSGTKESLGILYSPDWSIEERPAELKSNRSFHEPSPDKLQEELQIYLEQLCCYLVLDNVLTGYLFILYLNLRDETGRTYPSLRCYRVEMTLEDFIVLEQQIVETRDKLLRALADGSPLGLPLCRAWRCGKEQCPHWETCRPEGRWPELNKRRWTA